MARAGLGLSLHDLLYGSDYTRVHDLWWEYCKTHYVPIRDGRLAGSFTMYYDPLIPVKHPGDHESFMKLSLAQFVGPRRPDDARALFETVIDELKWRGPEPIAADTADTGLSDFDTLYGIVLAREYGEEVLYAKLKAYSEAHHEPTWDEATGEFTWGFVLGEAHPRGQLNGAAAMAELSGEGAWWNLFNRPNFTKLVEPTVYGVDFPKVCLSQASYDAERRLLAIAAAPGRPGAAGEATSFRVSKVRPEGAVVEIDGERSEDWRAVDGEIEISTTVGEHAIVVRLG